VIALGSADRPNALPGIAPKNVGASAELPQRLSLGDLDLGSFGVADDGWHATYRGEDSGTIVELEYHRAAPALTISSTWRGVAGPISDVPADGFASLAAAFMSFPETWDKLAKQSLAASYNVQLVETREHWPFNGFFPDGYAKTIICPVPVSQLRKCVTWLDNVREDQGIRTPTSASLTLGWSVVNYVEGKSPQAGEEPLDVEMAVTRALGTPLIKLPELQGPAGGSRALTVRRSHYILIVSCFFRDLERLVASLHGFGLVGNALDNEVREGYPGAHEYCAVVLPAGGERLLSEVRLFDRAGSRRVVYPKIVSGEEGPETLVSLSRSKILKLIEQAEEASAKLIADLETE
jgi:hypothetical protein